MKLLVLTLLLIFWTLITIFLVCTIIGIIMATDDNWTEAGKRLLNAIIDECD